MEIKAKCKCDLDSVKALVHLFMFKKADPKKRMTFWSISFLVLILIIIFELIMWGVKTILLVVLAVELIWLIIMWLWFVVIPKRQYKAMKSMQDALNIYTFSNDLVRIHTYGKEYHGEVEMEYSLFAKAYETEKHLFLFHTNNQVFVINKDTIEGGTVDDIRDRLTAFISDKYIICDY